MLKKISHFSLIVLCTIGLLACGQTGPLYRSTDKVADTTEAPTQEHQQPIVNSNDEP